MCPVFLTCDCIVSSPHGETLWRLHFLSRVHCSLLDLDCSNQTHIYLTFQLPGVGVCVWNTHSWCSEWIRLYEGKQLYFCLNYFTGSFSFWPLSQMMNDMCFTTAERTIVFDLQCIQKDFFSNPSNISLLCTINWIFLPFFSWKEV